MKVLVPPVFIFDILSNINTEIIISELRGLTSHFYINPHLIIQIKIMRKNWAMDLFQQNTTHNDTQVCLYQGGRFRYFLVIIMFFSIYQYYSTTRWSLNNNYSQFYLYHIYFELKLVLFILQMLMTMIVSLNVLATSIALTYLILLFWEYSLCGPVIYCHGMPRQSKLLLQLSI